MITSTINKDFKTTIPLEIREKFDISEGDIVEWRIDEKNKTVIVSFKKDKI